MKLCASILLAFIQAQRYSYGAFVPHYSSHRAACIASKQANILHAPLNPLQMSDWDSFADLDDDDLPSFTVADENDTQEYKAEVGAMYEAPELTTNVEPIFMPQGSQMELTEENIEGVLAACREEIGTLFGYSAENRGVGITGGVDFLYLDGPCVVLKLKGRFWHQRPTVLARVGAYIMGRIPEVIDVVVENPDYELSDAANENEYFY
eukprot:CAMPEP_0116040110 /NCGR_PEP_ID=MMETSP0321-20121206/24126_1 /TAXON_ID=163516 /ORGANISM="Leptocylindrus danicus var. danicus, Strain B650" /LENGTH=207 /DNA_ID=CAMNT_0003519787 /DNA_START=20 /DNA_END=643 /DNA_ORIENTATION=-